jgi:hypothetical protein
MRGVMWWHTWVAPMPWWRKLSTGCLALVNHLLLGWPLYLLFGVAGGSDYGAPTSHFWPGSSKGWSGKRRDSAELHHVRDRQPAIPDPSGAQRVGWPPCFAFSVMASTVLGLGPAIAMSCSSSSKPDTTVTLAPSDDLVVLAH